MAKRESTLVSKIDINMTPMIDVVFQLLTFFMLTLKSVVMEGDFNIRMPLGPSAGSAEEPIPPLIITMTASPDGQLAGVLLGGRSVVGRELLGEIASANAMVEAAAEAARNGDPDPLKAASDAKQRATAQLTQTIQAQILDTIGNDLSRAELTELELDCDPNLKYDHVVNAITAASGIVRGNEVVPLIQKIKFSPPKKAK